MASIIQPTDFIGQNNIPNKTEVGENLKLFIDKYEPKFLTKLLGAELYTELKDHATDARFVALLPYLKPAIVDYVYWFYLEDQNILNATSGAAKPKQQNSANASEYPKMVRAWNEMVEYNKETNKFLKDNETTYPEYTIVIPIWYYNWFDWGWYFEYGCNELPDIYRVKNSLGL